MFAIGLVLLVIAFLIINLLSVSWRVTKWDYIGVPCEVIGAGLMLASLVKWLWVVLP